MTRWNRSWTEYPHARQSKQFYPVFKHSKAREAYKLSRAKLSRLIKITTGHNNLNYHQSLISRERDNKCRFCSEEPETFFHFATTCPSFRVSREDFGLADFYLTSNWSLGAVLSFSFLSSIDMALTSRPEPGGTRDVSAPSSPWRGEASYLSTDTPIT